MLMNWYVLSEIQDAYQQLQLRGNKVFQLSHIICTFG